MSPENKNTTILVVVNLILAGIIIAAIFIKPGQISGGAIVRSASQKELEPPPIGIYNLPRGTYLVISAEDTGPASPNGSARNFVYTVLVASAFPARVQLKVKTIEPVTVGPVYKKGNYMTVIAPGKIQVD